MSLRPFDHRIVVSPFLGIEWREELMPAERGDLCGAQPLLLSAWFKKNEPGDHIQPGALSLCGLRYGFQDA